MLSARILRLLSVPTFACVLLAGAATLPGCGGGTVADKSAVEEDKAATAERNKTMEDYMKTQGKAGKKAK